MSNIATQLRHDAVDLRRLAELGVVPLDWRREILPAQSQPGATVLVIHDGTPSIPLVADLLRAISLAGATPQLSSETEFANAEDSRAIRLGGQTSAANAALNPDHALALPTPAQLCGNASAKREAWSKLRVFLRG